MSHPKIVLITGANQGLGFLTALLLCTPSPKTNNDNYHVILTARSLAKAKEAIKTLTTEHSCPSSSLTPIEIDVESPSSISSAFSSISKTHPVIDILINNAGIAYHNDNTHDTYTKIFATNVTGAATVTDTFLPMLLKSPNPRIIYVSSGLGSLSIAADSTNVFYKLDATAYRCSKAAMNMLALQQSKLLGEKGVKVWAVNPGYRATNLSGSAERSKASGATDPVLGAEVVAGVARGERDGEVGTLVSENGETLPW